ncbi:MAG: NYN domain-containing protein [Acidimicrobiales bacterium]
MAPKHHVVVDGSNLATEGRTAPSLAQLDEAVRAYLAEDPGADIVVVVDASFSHRIEASERAHLEAAELHGELVAPPAGAIGRGDAFVLRIAERTGATVLSNDSFQEFHEEHPWLFDDGRLIGGKPVPGVGWIFTPRRPVRGPKSRKAARGSEGIEDESLSAPRKAAEVAKALKRTARATAKKAKASSTKAVEKKGKAPSVKAAKATKKAVKAAEPAKAKKRGAKKKEGREGDGAKGPQRKPALKADSARVAKAAPPKHAPERTSTTKAVKGAKAATKVAAKSSKGAKKARAAKGPVGLKAAISQATEEVLMPADEEGGVRSAEGKAKRRRRVPPPPAVNEPLAFITFVAANPLGSAVEGVVASFTSHGAMVDVDLPEGGVLHCYAPLAGLGDPAPRAAREVLERGARRQFSLVALDPPRRMAELAFPELAARFVEGRSRAPQVVG